MSHDIWITLTRRRYALEAVVNELRSQRHLTTDELERFNQADRLLTRVNLRLLGVKP